MIAANPRPPVVLSRKRFETLRLGPEITITVIACHPGKVRFAVEAPDELAPSTASIPYDSVANYYDHVFLPDKLRDTATRFGMAVKDFVEFAGPKIRVDTVTEEMLSVFEQWLRDNGRKEKPAADLSGYIAAILRKACPGVELKKKKKPGRKPFVIPSMEEGTLWHFFETVYRPQRITSWHSVAGCHTVIRSLERFVGRTVLTVEFTEELIASYVNHLRNVDPQRINKLANHRTWLRAMWRLAKWESAKESTEGGAQ